MSTTIDQRVVEMRFDNQHFEKNVSTTMSTLEKLKQKLNLSGASKGLENVNSAAKKVDMNGLATGVETVRARFSALEVMGVTALANITNSAVNAGKRMISALTIDPIKTGFQEYETKINAIQTIMSNTASKGTTMADVTRVINELNTYADKTIYNFAEMTRNIGTFTAAGVGLEDSAAAIQGIANLAAASGSSSQQASTAMYQLSQALAAGTVKLMDWNSVVNAGMGGEKFQLALKATAREHGIAVDEMVEKHGSFRESLTEGWITADVLNDTLKKFTVEGAKEYADAMIASGKYTQEQADALVKEAQAMEDAATKVKTFTQLWDTMKESVQSGWGQTWELIIGDFEEAKEFLTGLSDMFGGVIEKFSNSRNDLLGGALNSNWEKLISRINEAGYETDVFEQKLRECAEAGNVDVDSMVEKYGSLGNAFRKGAIDSKYLKEAFDRLGESTTKTSNKITSDLDKIKRSLTKGLSGEDVKEMQQALVDLGFSLEQFGVDGIFGPETQAAVKAFQESVGLIADGIVDDETLAAMKKAGTTIEEIGEKSDKAKVSIDDLVDGITELGGRELLLSGLTNVIKSVIDVFGALGKAWRNTFDPIITSDGLFKIIESFHKFTEGLSLIDAKTGEFNQNGQNLVRTFEGIFAALDIVLTIIGGPLKIAFGIFKDLLSALDMDVLEFTANIADSIIAFRDWIDSTFDFTEIFKTIIPYVRQAASAIADWFNQLKNSQLAQDIISGLVTGLRSGLQAVWNAAAELAKQVIDGICDILGIASPAKKLIELGMYAVLGFVTGIINFIQKVFEAGKEIGTSLLEGVISAVEKVLDTVKPFAKKISDIIGKIDFGQVFALFTSGVLLSGIINIGKFVSSLANALDGVGDLFDRVGDAVTRVSKAFSSFLKAQAFSIRASAIKEIAIAIAILAGSLIALAYVPTDNLKAAGIALGSLAGGLLIFAGLMTAFGKGNILNSFKALADAAKLSGLLVSLSISLILFAVAMKMLAGIEGDMDKAITGVVLFGVVIGGLLAVSKNVVGIDHLASMISKLGISMLLLAVVMKIIAGMEWSELGKAAVGMAGLGLLISGLIKATNKSGPGIEHAGKTIRQMATAMLLLTITAKIIAGMEWSEMGKAAIGLGGLLLVVQALIKITNTSGKGKKIKDASKTIMAVGVCMVLLGVTARIISGMSWGEMGKAAIGLVGLAAIVTGLVYATNLAGGGAKLKRVSTTLLTMSICIGILAGIAVLLGQVDVNNLIKGEIAVGALAGLMTVMIRATKGASNVKGSIIAMSIAIGVLAVAAVALSFVDTAKLAKATAALAILLLSFSALTRSMKSLKAIKIGPLITMIGVIAILSGIVYLLSELDCEQALPSVVALSILMLAFMGSLRLLAQGGRVSKTVSAQIIPMLAVTAGLAAILIAMSHWSDPQVLIPAALSLSILLGALAGSLFILSKSGPMTSGSIVPAMLMGVVLAEIAVILGILANKVKNVDALIPTAVSLSILLVALAAACAILAPIGATGPAALTGAGILAGVVAILGLVAIAIGEVMSLIPQSKIDEWKQGIDNFMELLKSLASGLGEAIGAFIGGIAMGVLEGVGQGLTNFMNNAQGFIDGAKSVDGSVLEGAGILAAAILALTVADFVNGVTTLFSGDVSLALLGAELSTFMKGAEGFIAGAKDIDPAMAEGIKGLASAILILTAADFVDGITRLFGMDSSLADFGKELEAFGPSIKAFSDQVQGIDNEAVTAAAEAGKTLAEMAKTLPNEGGFFSKLFGDNNMDAFGEQLTSFGKSLKSFSDSVTGLDTESIDVAVTASESIVGLADTIPNMGGLFSFLAGDNDFATFGEQLVAYGKSLVSFSSTVTGLSVEPIENSVAASEALVALADSIPNSGGVVSLFTGDNDFETFGEELVAFGNALVNYSNATGGINIENINNSVSAAKSLSKLADAFPESGGLKSKFTADNDMSTFGSELKKFGSALAAYSVHVASMDAGAVSTSIINARAIITLIDEFSGMDTSGVATFKTAISELGTVSLDSVREAFSGGIPDIKGICDQLVSAISTTFSGAAPKMLMAGTQMITSLNAGITSKIGAVQTTIIMVTTIALTSFMSRTPMFMDVGTSLIVALANGISNSGTMASASIRIVVLNAANMARSGYSGFYEAGAYCMIGFANGIAANGSYAINAAVQVALQALAAAKAAIGVASPSKEFYKVGDFAGQGFVNALNDYSTIAYRAGAEMADNAREGLNAAISKLNTNISTGISAKPAIRPVLDLSSVQNGIGLINGLFANRSLALADVNTSFTTDTDRLSDILSQIQDMNDTSNTEVVQMISDLRGDFGDLIKAISSLKLYMNGDTVVGELIGKIDSGLGRIATHKGRRN